MDIGEAQVQVARQALVGMAVERTPRRARASSPRAAARAARAGARPPRPSPRRHSSHASPKPTMLRHGQRAAAHAAFVAAAVEERLEAHMRVATADVQGADPFGPYILWADRLSRSTCQVVHIDGDLADRLRRVGVQAARRAPCRAGRSRPSVAACRSRCSRSHDADEDGLLGQIASATCCDRHPAMAIDRQNVTSKPSRCRRRHGSRTAWCSVCSRDEVVALPAVHARRRP